MNALTQARRDVSAYLAGEPTAYTGSFEAIHQIMFGPLKHDAHVRAFRAHQFYTDQTRRFAAADVDMCAWLAERGVKL